MVELPAFATYAYRPDTAIQHAACWPSVTGPASATSDPSRRTTWVDAEFVPASTTTSRPNWSNENANGTAPVAGFATGAPSRPSNRTGKPTTVPCDLVVTRSSRPSGVNPT